MPFPSAEACPLPLQPEPAPVQHFVLASLPIDVLSPNATKAMLSGQHGTIAHFVLQRGALVPLHQHPNEQYSLVLQGSLRAGIAGQEIVVRAGEGLIIPPNVPHWFEALEDNTIDIDFFTPVRHDWNTTPTT